MQRHTIRCRDVHFGMQMRFSQVSGLIGCNGLKGLDLGPLGRWASQYKSAELALSYKAHSSLSVSAAPNPSCGARVCPNKRQQT